MVLLGGLQRFDLRLEGAEGERIVRKIGAQFLLSEDAGRGVADIIDKFRQRMEQGSGLARKVREVIDQLDGDFAGANRSPSGS